MAEDKTASGGEVWFVRGEDGQVFGPVDEATLVTWAREARLEPTTVVSRDQRTWMPAPRVRALEMIWLVETEAAAFYGPFHRAVIDRLQETGSLAKSARLYRLDDGAAEARAGRLEAELAAKAQALADLQATSERQAETTRQTIAFMEKRLTELEEGRSAADASAAAELAAARDEVYAGRERAEKAEAAAAEAAAAQAALERKLKAAEGHLADLRAQLDAVTRFSKKAAATPAAIVPEVVVVDGPPPAQMPHLSGESGASGLAALEAAAQRELQAARRQGLGLGGIFGGKRK